MIQTNLMGEKATLNTVWVFIGIFSAEKFGITHNEWWKSARKELKKPKPRENIIDNLDAKIAELEPKDLYRLVKLSNIE